MQSKPKWGSPQLVVLGRGTPEEAVLQVCKNQTADGPTASGACHTIGVPPKGQCIHGVTGS